MLEKRGIVDQERERSQRLRRAGHQPVHVAGRGEVAGERGRPAARRLDIVHHGRRFVGRMVAMHRHVIAPFGKR